MSEVYWKIHLITGETLWKNWLSNTILVGRVVDLDEWNISLIHRADKQFGAICQTNPVKEPDQFAAVASSDDQWVKPDKKDDNKVSTLFLSVDLTYREKELCEENRDHYVQTSSSPKQQIQAEEQPHHPRDS